MKKLLVLTAVAALVATTAVEARGGFGGARGFSGGRSFIWMLIRSPKSCFQMRWCATGSLAPNSLRRQN